MRRPLKGFRARGLRSLALALALGLLLGTGMPAVLPAYAQDEAAPEGTPTFTPTATPEIGAQTVEGPAGEPTAEPTPEPDVDATESPAPAETPAGEPTEEASTVEQLLDGLEPSFSADGDNADDLAPVLVIVEDPSPDREVIQIPDTGEIMMRMLASASVSVEYVGAGQTDRRGNTCSAFPPDAQVAVNYAAALWEARVSSPVPIKIRACWLNISGNTLGFSQADSLHLNFLGAPRPNTYYATALRNALNGNDVNGADAEIHVAFNLNKNWYTGSDANPPVNAFDLVTVALHEIAHGLNFFGSARTVDSVLRFGFGDNNYPIIYDHFVEDGSGIKLINYANPSTALTNLLTGNNLWFRGDHSFRANGGSRVKIYAPSPFVDGSSFSHLDYDWYSNTINNLMVYSINAGTAIHNTGPVVQGVLRDLGWDILPQSQEAPSNPTLLVSPSHQTGVPYDGTQDVVMEWSADAQAAYDSSLAGYSILWDQNPDGMPDTLADLPPDTYSASEQLSFGEWYFHLRACDIYEHCAPAMHVGPFIIGTADVVPPGNPTSINSTSHTIGLINTVNNVISMQWSADASDNGGSGVAGYSVLWDQSPAGIPDDTVDVPVGQLTASSLPLANGDWYFHLKTCDFSGNCAPDAVHRGPYLIRVYPPPVLFEPEIGASPENRRPRFEWSALEGATSYVLQVSRYRNFRTSALKVTTGSAYYQPASDLPRGRTLYWRVRAQGGFGRTAWSQVFSYNSPATPSTPKLRSPGNGALVRSQPPLLRWYASNMLSGSVFAYYQLQLARDPGFTDLVYEDVQKVGRYNTSFLPAEELTPLRRYYWRVRAFNDQGQYSAWSAVRNFRQAIPPPDLITPAAEETTANRSPQFSWSPVEGAASYTIQVSRYASFSTRIFSATVYEGGTTFTSAKNLPAGRRLYWRVRSNHAIFGPSRWSGVRQFYTPPS